MSEVVIYRHLKLATRCAIGGLFGNGSVQSVMLKGFNLIFRRRLDNCRYGTIS